MNIKAIASTNFPTRILLSSLIGTAIECFDFYIYSTAAVLVFPKLFFPSSEATSSILASLATFSLAFLARPIGSLLFGHFGDRIGRKTTLVATLFTMGLSTIFIGLLPTYASIGIVAPILLSLCRIGQGIGFGGEFAGAILLAIENAPPRKVAWYGMFPQLGAPLGFFCSGVLFLFLSIFLNTQQFLVFGWRLPFLASSALIILGLYLRSEITETPAFLKTVANHERVKIPVMVIMKKYFKELILGCLLSVVTFALFFLMTVFTLSWGTTHLGYQRNTFLMMQLLGILFFAATLPFSAALADRWGTKKIMIVAFLGIIFFGFMLGSLFSKGSCEAIITLIIGFFLMGFAYAPLGPLLAELYPTPVRYTGSSISFNLAGILGASLTPYIATSLALQYGVQSVGYYLSATALVSLIAVILTLKLKESKHHTTAVSITNH